MELEKATTGGSPDAPDGPQARAIVPSPMTEARPPVASTSVAEVLAAEARRGGGRRVGRIVLAAAAAAIVIGAAGWGWWMWQSHATPAYVTEPVGRGDLIVTLSATGELHPTREVGVSSLITGTIASVDVDYNQVIAKGQPLAHLDPADYDARRRRAVASVEAEAAAREVAAATVSDATAALDRARKLPAGETVSTRDVELATTMLARAQANLALAEAQLRAAQADLASAQNDYDRTTIVSPLDGVVLDVGAKVGESVGTATLGTSLFILASDLKNLDLELDVDEADIARVEAGDQASFTVESAPDRPLTGVIRQLRSAPSVTEGITSYKAIVAVDNSSGLLRPGMTATADIQTDRATGVLTVSNAALRFVPKGAPARKEGEAAVYVLRNGVQQLVTVTTGISDGRRTEVTSGDIVVGDQVVTAVKDR